MVETDRPYAVWLEARRLGLTAAERDVLLDAVHATRHRPADGDWGPFVRLVAAAAVADGRLPRPRRSRWWRFCEWLKGWRR